MSGLELKKEGMQLVLEFESADWKASFLTFAERFAKSCQFVRMEEIRMAWLAAGHPHPHSQNVYGAMASQLVRRGVLVYDSHTAAKSAKTHGHRVALYRAGI